MTRNRDFTTDGESAEDSGLDRFERNRYFHGKLMTARDMAADQAYHRDRLRTQARLVGGRGVACGLNVTVTDADDGGVTVIVDRGYGLDGNGNPIVVDNETRETFGPSEVDTEDRVAVSIAYRECFRETVPVPGAEDACNDECEYNRVLEFAEIICEEYDDDTDYAKGVPSVSFPTKGDLSGPAKGDVPPTDPGLATIARSYTAGNGDEGDCATGDGRVFLGIYEPTDGDTWSRVPGAPARERVYTNDMLYAATARHTADFENPHQSSLATEDATAGARLHIDDDRSEDADVTVTSSDSVLTISVDEDSQEINLTTGEALEKVIERRIAPMEQYIMDKSLKYTYRIFSGVASAFDTETAGEIAQRTKEAADDRAYASKSSYREFIEEIHDLEVQLVDELRGDVTEGTMSRYEEAVDRLETVLENVAEKGVLALAVAQDEVCEGADWFEQPDMPPIEIPGGTLPGGSLLPKDPLRPIDPSLPGWGGDDGGDDGGIEPIQPQPFDPTHSGTTTPIDSTPTIEMPDLTGQTTEIAEETLSNAGLDATVETQPVENSTALEGVGVNEVTEQEVTPGETVQPGDSVTVTVNEPPTVDRIDGVDDAAKTTLEDAGVETVGQLAASDTRTLTDASLDESTAERIQSKAKTYAEAHQLTKIEGVSTDEAEALADTANVTTIEGLESTPNEQIEESATTAAESGAASGDAAETVAGMDLETATENATALRLQSTAGTTDEPSTTVTEKPEGGATKTSISVPDLTGQSKETAEDALSSAGLTPEVEIRTVADPTELQAIGVNEVVDQDPSHDTSVPPDTTVTITVNEPPPVTRIEGIGDATAEKLATAGIETVGELARADVATISDATGASETRASEWQSRARRYTGAYELTKAPGVGTDEAEALADVANVDSIRNVHNTDTEIIEAATEAAKTADTADEETVEKAASIDLDEVKSSLKTLEL
ncbi:PASTA domain-containing protein [Halopenitus sp. H-Gu1]|uniref:PASTA domain-containing protein n=1 Tax=Halopenitus sp. H-Gu1 TaxID=3242697 RepID=UPI00359E070B